MIISAPCRERDVGVLIPAHGRIAMTVQAAQSALAAGAGEVIVSEDASGEDVAGALAALHDSRLRVVVQPSNLGLWRNHLALLHMTQRPWIKFLQTDDTLAPDSLRQMCEVVTADTTMVSALPIYRDLDTGREDRRYRLDEPLRWPSGGYVHRMAQVGNEPGRPSYTLFRRDALRLTEEAWRNDMSCDLVANVLAAAQGEVVLLPPGPVFCGQHPGRDAVNQSFDLLADRLIHAMEYLAAEPNDRIRRFVSVYGTVETFGLLRIFGGKRRRGHPLPLSSVMRHMARARHAVRLGQALRHAAAIQRYARYKYMMGRATGPIRIHRHQP